MMRPLTNSKRSATSSANALPAKVQVVCHFPGDREAIDFVESIRVAKGQPRNVPTIASAEAKRLMAPDWIDHPSETSPSAGKEMFWLCVAIYPSEANCHTPCAATAPRHRPPWHNQRTAAGRVRYATLTHSASSCQGCLSVSPWPWHVSCSPRATEVTGQAVRHERPRMSVGSTRDEHGQQATGREVSPATALPVDTHPGSFDDRFHLGRFPGPEWRSCFSSIAPHTVWCNL